MKLFKCLVLPRLKDHLNFITPPILIPGCLRLTPNIYQEGPSLADRWASVRVQKRKPPLSPFQEVSFSHYVLKHNTLS